MPSTVASTQHVVSKHQPTALVLLTLRGCLEKQVSGWEVCLCKCSFWYKCRAVCGRSDECVRGVRAVRAEVTARECC